MKTFYAAKHDSQTFHFVIIVIVYLIMQGDGTARARCYRGNCIENNSNRRKLSSDLDRTALRSPFNQKSRVTEAEVKESGVD